MRMISSPWMLTTVAVSVATAVSTAASGGVLPTGELLADPGWNSDAAPLSPFFPRVAGAWLVEDADIIIGSDAGIAPYEGDGMLRMNSTGGNASQVRQFVDVSAFAAEIDQGTAVARYSVRTNADVADITPVFQMRAGTLDSGVFSLNGGQVIDGYNRIREDVATDADTGTWHLIEGVAPIPSGTRTIFFGLNNANSDIPPTGNFFDDASLTLESCEGLVDGGFDSDSNPLQPYARFGNDPPWMPGEWNAENADLIVGSSAGVTPFFGDGMLRVNLAFTTSQVSQIVDLRDYATAIDEGGVAARFSAWFNAAESGARPRVFLRAGEQQNNNGTLQPTGGNPINGVNQTVLNTTADDNAVSWEAIGAPFTLPPGTRFLHFEVRSPGNNHPASGLFYDNASVCLRAALPTFGLPLSTVGQVGIVVSEGAFEINSFGSSGMDGFGVALGEAQDIAYSLESNFFDGAPVGASITHTKVLDDTSIEFTSTKTADGFELSSPLALGATSKTVEAYRNGELVGSVSGHTGIVDVGVTVTPNGNDDVIQYKSNDNPDIDYLCCLPEIDVEPSNVALPGGLVVTADEILVRFENPTIARTFTTALEVRGVDIAPVTITDAALGFGSSNVRARGDARMAGASGASSIVVDNLGSSGEDGVAIENRDPGEDLRVALDAEDPIDLDQDGQSLTLGATGVLDGAPQSDLGTASFTSDGASLDVSADFAALGATQVIVEIWNDGSLVGGAIVPSGGSVGVINPPMGDPICPVVECGKILDDAGTPCFIGRWETDFTYSDPTRGTPVTGDEIRLLASGAAGAVESVGELIITGTDLGGFTMTDIVVSVPCPADLTGDGIVGSADLALLLGNWGSGGQGDFDDSGAVGSDDLAVLLGSWGPCPGA